MKRKAPVYIRWLNGRDLRAAEQIGLLAGNPWTAAEIDRDRRNPNVVLLAAEYVGVGRLHGQLAGFAAYYHDCCVVQVLNIVVDRRFRRLGVGSELLSKIIARAERKGIPIRAAASESNLAAQCFLRAAGFKCVRVMESERGEAYWFERVKNGVFVRV